MKLLNDNSSTEDIVQRVNDISGQIKKQGDRIDNIIYRIEHNTIYVPTIFGAILISSIVVIITHFFIL